MNRITVDSSLTSKLDALDAPVEVVDETGRTLGHFVPTTAAVRADDCPFSVDELQRMRAENGGRSLEEIWKSLGAE
jgi:hypothetical protein